MPVKVTPIEGFTCHGPGAAEAELVQLESPSGISCTLTSFGATLLRLQVRCGEEMREVSRLLDEEDLPCKFGTYAGATVGRVANRIAGAKFTLGEETFELAANCGKHALHGGPGGFHAVNWTKLSVEENEEEMSAEFQYTSADGEEGYPGGLVVRARYTLSKTAPELGLVYSYKAVGKPTVANICNHVYFNLLGPASKTVRDHELSLSCPSYLPVDADSIPLGSLDSVVGTPFDFLAPVKLGERIDLIGEGEHRGVDHCFCAAEPDDADASPADDANDDELMEVETPMEKRTYGGHPFSMKPMAELSAGGLQLSVASTQPGIQVYTGNFMPGEHRHSAVALETQHLPDGVNQEANNPKFGGTVLEPGEFVRQATLFAFKSTT